jgi:hypothetical protein
MTPKHFAEIKRRAQRALKHSGKGEWSADGRIIVGHVDDKAEKTFVVASIDDFDQLPVAAGEAIAAHIESAQPSAVLALCEEIERLERMAFPAVKL